MVHTLIAFAAFLPALGGPAGPSPVRTIHIAYRGAVQSGFRFAAYGDTRDGHEVHRKLVALIGKERPDFVVNTGDLVNRGTRAELWKIFDDIISPLRKSTLYFAVPGNHDWGDTEFMKRFPAQTTLAGKHSFFSFDHGGSHMVALSVDEHTDYDAGSEQYKWLQQDLAANRPKAKHIFVFFHVPPYSIGNHASDLDVRKALCPLFEKYHVDAVFNGHDHLYYRTTRHGVLYVVTGGGGAGLHSPDPSKGAISGDKYEKVNHYVVVDVSGSGIKVKAIRADGTVLDSFSVGAGVAAAATR